MRKALFIIALIGSTTAAHAQSTAFDIWTGYGTSYDITDKFRTSVELGLRSSDFSMSRTFTDLGFRYYWNKYFRVGVGWRYAGHGNPFDVSRISNRFHLDLIGRYKMKPFTFALRERIQSRYSDMFVSDDGLDPDTYSRTKLTVSYDGLKDIGLSVGFEPYYSLSRSSQNFMDKYRIYAGLEFDIDKYHSIEFNYIYIQEIQVARPDNKHVLAFGYSYDLMRKVKKIRKKRNKKERQQDNILLRED